MVLTVIPAEPWIHLTSIYYRYLLVPFVITNNSDCFVTTELQVVICNYIYMNMDGVRALLACILHFRNVISDILRESDTVEYI